MNLMSAASLSSLPAPSFPRSSLPFVKMQGMGNDFVIIRDPSITLSPALIQKIAHRREGVGCDQVLAVRTFPPGFPQKGGFLQIWNADGSLAEACGNGTRCVVWLLAKGQGEGGAIVLESSFGALEGFVTAPFQVEVIQGFPKWEWHEVPLSRPLDKGFIDLSPWCLPPGFVVNIGNPHLVIFVPSVVDISLETLGPQLEHHPFFPKRTNVEFVEIKQGYLKMRVWERGVGPTPSCGSGACAAASIALKQGYIKGPIVRVHLDGGPLEVIWKPGHPLRQKGPVSFVFEGAWPL